MYLLENVDAYDHAGAAENLEYFLDLQPVGSSRLAAISTDQQLILLDPSGPGLGPVRTVRTSHGNITVMGTLDLEPWRVCTAGSDGSLAVWDLRSTDPGPAQQIQSIGVSIESLACAPSSNLVAVGSEFMNNQASVVAWDIRSATTPVVRYTEVHSDDITALSFHSTDAHTLSSGSTDGLVNVYDLRIADEDDVVVQTFNHGASIHRASFLGQTELFALSHDEKLAIYDMDERQDKGCATVDFGDIRPQLACQYVANVLPGANSASAVVGAGSQDQERFELVHLSKSTGWGLHSDSVVGLAGAHRGEVVRAFRIFDMDRAVFTAGEDGLVKAWRALA